jgi:excisionase family DNA binding protein
MQEPQARAPERVWLTYAEASARTALHPTTLWRAVRRGDLRVGGTGRAPRFHIADIDEFMRRGGTRWNR